MHILHPRKKRVVNVPGNYLFEIRDRETALKILNRCHVVPEHELRDAPPAATVDDLLQWAENLQRKVRKEQEEARKKARSTQAEHRPQPQQREFSYLAATSWFAALFAGRLAYVTSFMVVNSIVSLVIVLIGLLAVVYVPVVGGLLGFVIVIGGNLAWYKRARSYALPRGGQPPTIDPNLEP